jgi:branched-chain amino acid transport system substrate-binding protein
MRSLGIILLAGLMLSISGCGGGGTGSVEEIKVGAVLSLSGNYEIYGQGIKRGMDLALAELNKNKADGQKDFSVIYEDSGSTIDGAREAFNKLVNQEVKVIIGPETTDLAKPLIEMAKRHQIILLSPSASSPSLRNIDSGQYFFRICTTDESETDQIANDIVRERREKWLKRGYTRTLILQRDENPYTRGLLVAISPKLNELNISYELVKYNAQDLQAGLEEGEEWNPVMTEMLDKAKTYKKLGDDEAELGTIVIFGLASDADKILRALNTLDFEKKIYSSSAVDTTEFLVNSIDVYDGLIFPRLFDPFTEDYPEVVTFVTAFKDFYDGQIPDLYAAYGYDAALLIGRTLRETDDIGRAISDPRNFRLAMNDLDFKGATGSVDFNRTTGEVAKVPTLYILTSEHGAKTINDYEDMLLEEKRKLRDEM